MTCDKCLGFGVWAVGMPVPMTEQHFNKGMPSKPCPECGSGKREKINPKEDNIEKYLRQISNNIHRIALALEVKNEGICK